MLELVRANLKGNLRLWMEFFITVLVLVGAGVMVFLPPANAGLNQRAYELTTLVLGYWFGRGIAIDTEKGDRPT